MPISGGSTITMLDNSNEKSVVRVNAVELTAANIVAQEAAFAAFLAGVAGITLGVVTNTIEKAQDETFINPTPPADENAQRERKWLVQYYDTTTGERNSFSLPTADLTGFLLADSDKADLAVAAMATFVTAAEAYVRSPAGNPINILAIVHVGRNL